MANAALSDDDVWGQQQQATASGQPMSDADVWGQDDTNSLGRQLNRTGRDIVGGVANIAAFAPQVGMDVGGAAAYTIEHQLPADNPFHESRDYADIPKPSLVQPIMDVYDKLSPGAEPRNKTEEYVDQAAQMLPALALGEAPGNLAQTAVRATGLGVSGITGAAAGKAANDWVSKNFPNNPLMSQLVGTTAQVLAMGLPIAGAHIAEGAMQPPKFNTPADIQATAAKFSTTSQVDPEFQSFLKSAGLADATAEQDQAVQKGLVEPAAANLTTALKANPAAADVMTAAKAAGALDGEDVYMGLKEPTAAQSTAMEQASSQLSTSLSGFEPRPDLDTAVRAQNPELFNKYDDLQRQQEFARDDLNDLLDARDEKFQGNEKDTPQIQAETDVLQKQIDAIRNGKDDSKLSATKLARIQDLQSQVDNLGELADHVAGKDAPKMSAARLKLVEAQQELRRIAPDIKKATLAAHEDLSLGSVEPPEETAPKPVDAVSPDTEAHKQLIEDYVAKKLTDIGRPAEEAQASGKITASFFQTMSDIYGGTRGTALDWYDREGASIIAGKEKAVKELAKPDKGELGQRAQGKIRLANDAAKATIKLFKAADASTFMHESAHQFLDIISRYANMDDAPERLKNDYNTIKKWLGPEKGEYNGFARAQHEKFARGFERYLMEGVAPSRELAGVFSKFQKWLTDIYQTVQKLRAPITDEVRDVFDRLLSKNPEKTVISPASEPGKMISDVHIQEAESTPPEQAAGARDDIRKEIDRVAQQHDPEIANAIKSAESAEPSTGTPEVAEPAASSTETPSGPTATAEPAVTSQPAEVPAGGGATQPEGSTTPVSDIGNADRTNTNDGSGTDAGRTGKTQSGFIKPDGTINEDTLNYNLYNNTPEWLQKYFNEYAEKNGDAFTGSKETLESMRKLSKASGWTPEEIQKMEIGQKQNRLQQLASAELFKSKVEEVKTKAAQAAASGDPKDLVAFFESTQDHKMLMDLFKDQKQYSAEASRNLGIRRAIRGLPGMDNALEFADLFQKLTDQNPKDVTKQAELLQKLTNPDQATRFLKDGSQTPWQKFRSQILEYYVNALISGPITHLRYSIGNAINALWTPLVQIPAAAGIGALREAITGEKATDRVYLGEAGAQLHSLLQGSTDGLRAAATAFKQGFSDALPGEKLADNFLDRQKRANTIPGKLGETINIPSQSVTAIHSFFKVLRYTQNIAGLAYRTAMSEGLDGDALKNRVADLTNKPTDEMMRSATEDAMRELYMAPTDAKSPLSDLSRAVNKSTVAKIIVPFMKIGTQITMNAFKQQSPLGLLDKGVRENALYNNGGATGDMQIAKIAVGTALMGAVTQMTLNGLATGDGPNDPAARAIWLLNHRPNSITIGGITIPYQGLGSLGMLMRLAANMTETSQHWSDEDGTKLAGSVFEGITKSVLDDTWMKGLKDALDAVYHPVEYGGNFIKSFATNWLPYSVGMSQTAKLIDPYERQSKSIFDEARAKTPFLSETLQPKRDRFGVPIPNSGKVQSYANDPVVQRMEALNTGIGRIENKINGVPLNDQQFDDYSRIAGKMTKMRLDAVVNQPGFSAISAAKQIEVIHKNIDAARTAARAIVVMQNPIIAQTALKNKISANRK